MLKITSDGRKIGLDQRLMNPMLPDDPNSKLNACVGNILRIYEDGNADQLTQLVFCDLSTPKKDGTSTITGACMRGHLRPRLGQPITPHNEQLHSDIYLYLQRPPKIESLANFEPIGRGKIPLN